MNKPISNNEFDSLDAFFGDKLKDASMFPSEKVWQQIEGSLNKDRKRKRRFLWIFFSGMFLIGTTIATYFIVFDTKKSNTSQITEVKNTTTVVKSTATNSTAANNHIESKVPIKQTIGEPIPKEKNNKTVKIQLGAFKKRKDRTYFSKLNLEIKSENIQNGITRYYAEVSENNIQQALEQIKQNGFRDAFIKEESLPVNNSNTTINTSVAKNNSAVNREPIMATTKNTQERSIVITKQKQPSNSNIIVKTNKVNTEQSGKTTAASNETNTTTTLAVNNHISQNQASDSGITKNNVSNTTPTNTTVIASSSVNNDVVLKDSLQKDTTINEVATAKKDSVMPKSDSVKTTIPIATIDSSNKAPILSKWALLLTGGPNFFLKNTQSNLFAASGEKQPSTYNATLKVEFKPFKRLAFTMGVSYSYFIAQQDATAFSFNKNLTSDYIFYSSYGPMAVDKNTMLQSFSTMAPVTMFHANYSYTSRINILLVPVQSKYYYLNTKRVNLFADIGISGMMVLSQQTNLSVIKENLTNNVLYNQITTNKFNGLLMLGLGGDVRLYKQLYLTIDEGFRYSITNLSNTLGIKTSPAYFSSNGGIKIKF